jgi:ATP-binding protein involved in chromosome partitioning
MSLPWKKDNEQIEPGINKVTNIIAIASGKGGVGKSTISVNLAVALAKSGARVGLLDADIYGPSQPGMLGSTKQKPEIVGNMLIPVESHGVRFISMGLLLADDGPVIWRAPMAMKMIHQFLGSVVWGELDYLLIDLPPGTGDVQLTLAQQASLSGAIIVTTPQDVALSVARKGLKMFEQVKVPILGIVENMSGFTCEHCNKITAIFSSGGGQKMADENNVPLLGALPLDPEIMVSGEAGDPILTKSQDSVAAKAMLELSGNVMNAVEKMNGQLAKTEPRVVELVDGKTLQITWPDDHASAISAFHLRANCPCAECVDEDSGQRVLNAASIPLDITMRGYNEVGRYGFAIEFSDGHNTGIYSHELLRKLCECDSCANASKDKEESFSV